jgi:hypothetical protein
MASCTVHLYSLVESGHALVVGGSRKNNCDSFKVKFLKNDDSTKVLFVIDAKLDKNLIALSSQHGEKNHIDENDNVAYKVDAICERNLFKFYILIIENKFFISLNDKQLCSYEFNFNLDFLRTVKIFGNVNTKQVDHRALYPCPWPPSFQEFSTVGFSADVPSRFTPNTVIVIRMILMGAQTGRFFVRFNELGSMKQLFHFNPRFDEQCIVANSMNDNLE